MAWTVRSGGGQAEEAVVRRQLMRGYRARQRDRSARLVDPDDASDALVDNRKFRDRVAQLEDERDRLWAQIVRLQDELRPRATEPRCPSVVQVAGRVTFPSRGQSVVAESARRHVEHADGSRT